MNVKRFTARTSRDALALVRQAFGNDAVVLSTRPCAEGVEVLAMAPESVQQFERVSMPPEAPVARSKSRGVAPLAEPPAAAAPQADGAAETTTVSQDAERLAMSTLSFQDYVRERMLRRRKAEIKNEGKAESPAEGRPEATPAKRAAARTPVRNDHRADIRIETRADPRIGAHVDIQLDHHDDVPHASPLPGDGPYASAFAAEAALRAPVAAPRARQVPTPTLYDDEPADAPTAAPAPRPMPAVQPPVMAAEPAAARRDQAEMMSELRAMKGLIEERFGALAFMEKLQRQPRQALLSQKLLDCGFSPALIRKMVDSLPDDTDEVSWAAGVLERNFSTGEHEPALEESGGVFALIGSTGVGKTTSTAKLAAAFATKHGAANLGLVTLDAYRVGAHEQLRTYGRILGVPVHTAHDRASLEDLLDLLSGKKMVLIDTAGMAQRDARTRELLDMVSHRAVQRLLVVNAAAQGETIEDVLVAYRAGNCRGVVLSKLDEAVKIGPAVDAMIRHKLKVLAVANGQRVPEDWHRLSAATLVQRALRGGGSAAWKLDAGDVSLVFAGSPAQRAGAVPGGAGARA